MNRFLRVLVVEDEEIVRETIKRILKSEGFTVHTAECGKSAIEIAKTSELDVALLDIKLPGIDGIDTLIQLKTVKPEILAVMMTGYEVTERIEKAFAEGALACLHKPFDIKVLLDIFNELKEKNEAQ